MSRIVRVDGAVSPYHLKWSRRIRRVLHAALLVGPAHFAGGWALAHDNASLRETARQGFPAEALTVPTHINVEVDYMYTSGHVHRLHQPEIDMLVAMFACQGITLNIEVSDSVPETPILVGTGTDLFTNNSPGQFAAINAAYYDHTGQSGWHYCIIGHRCALGSTSFEPTGVAELLGDDLLVAPGILMDSVGTTYDRTFLIAHELGHNLGLDHAGNQNQLVVGQYKPNYASVMNYRFSFASIRLMYQFCSQPLSDTCLVLPFKHLDYSHGTLAELNEAVLIEADGMGYGPVDWNCNGQIDAGPVTQELGSTFGWCGATGQSNVLRDFDDWSNIADVTFAAPPEALLHRPYERCMSAQELLQLQQGMLASAAQVCLNPWSPPLVPEDCAVAQDDTDADGVLATCDDCPNDFDPLQADVDMDGTGDACDNCPGIANANQADPDTDGTGEACDNCPGLANVLQENFDGDPLGDACDPCPAYATPGHEAFTTGDVTGDGSHTSSDIIHLVNYTFKGGPTPIPVAGAGDVNCDGLNTSSDVIFLVNFVFKGGQAPCNACAL